MVRFIIEAGTLTSTQNTAFTFQYGQIYYKNGRYELNLDCVIYIPIWLDLLFELL